MSEPSLDLIGVDGGGTSTRGLRATPEGRLVAASRAGPSNPTSTSMEETGQSLRAVFRALAASETPGRVAVCLGLAGVGFSGKREPVESLARTILAGEGFAAVRVTVITDAEAALEAATEGAEGSVLIAGTGSVALGRNRQGDSERVGGWGLTLGDEGSGAWIGRELLRSAARESDGRERASGLSDRVAKALGLANVQALVPLVYGPPPLRAVDFAGFARLALDWAAEGDPTAQDLIDRAAQELSLHVRTLWRRLSLPPEAPLGLSGGILAPASPVAAAVTREIDRCLGVTATPLTLPPAVGALFAAARETHGPGAVRPLAKSPRIRSVSFPPPGS